MYQIYSKSMGMNGQLAGRYSRETHNEDVFSRLKSMNFKFYPARAAQW